eukprot:TRINITY_DN500_c0_g1_i1.p1 TRINITY_DN500_c0_g1~~TRINITY_DN500_c0_g1_i1.p1  ORF type:complete len:377 (+),score=46.16 TRINITY_DN500_c0_g1_i1:1694-2824(+)
MLVLVPPEDRKNSKYSFSEYSSTLEKRNDYIFQPCLFASLLLQGVCDITMAAFFKSFSDVVAGRKTHSSAYRHLEAAREDEDEVKISIPLINVMKLEDSSSHPTFILSEENSQLCKFGTANISFNGSAHQMDNGQNIARLVECYPFLRGKTICLNFLKISKGNHFSNSFPFTVVARCIIEDLHQDEVVLTSGHHCSVDDANLYRGSEDDDRVADLHEFTRAGLARLTKLLPSQDRCLITCPSLITDYYATRLNSFEMSNYTYVDSVWRVKTDDANCIIDSMLSMKNRIRWINADDVYFEILRADEDKFAHETEHGVSNVNFNVHFGFSIKSEVEQALREAEDDDNERYGQPDVVQAPAEAELQVNEAQLIDFPSHQ